MGHSVKKASKPALLAHMPNIPDDWKKVTNDFPKQEWLYALMEGGGKLRLTTLARVWLEKLAQVGLREVDPNSGSPPKQSESGRVGLRTGPSYREPQPMKPGDSREVLWLEPNGHRTDRGYKSVEVLESLLSTDKAILAALTNLEAEEVDVERLGKALSSIEPPFKKTMYEYLVHPPTEIGRVQLESLGENATDEESIEYLRSVAETMPQRQEFYNDLQVGTLEYVVALLRHYRPEFDNLPNEEQKDLIKACCERVNRLLQASRQLGAFLEYGNPLKKDLRRTIEKAQEYVRAAELKDVEGLSDTKIGEILGIDPAPSDSLRRQNSRVNHAVKKGRGLLYVLGE